jgi:hypothetical protein
MAVRSVAQLAGMGTAALRGALYGARLGAGAAGAAFGRGVVEKLGVEVGKRAATTAAMVRNAPSLIVEHAGAALEIGTQGRVAARVSEATLHAIASSTVRGALSQVARATLRGAAAGAAIDAIGSAIGLIGHVRNGSMTKDAAARRVAKRAGRGAVAGAAGVAAASGTAALLAATGLGVLGAPIVVPLVAMAAASSFAMTAFDRRFPDARPKPGRTIVG